MDPITEAIWNDDLKEIQKLISSGEDINKRSEFSGQTPIHLALQENKKEIAIYLVENGANLNIIDNNGLTPLMIAVDIRSRDMVELLLGYGANVDAIDEYGETCLHKAIDQNSKIAHLLLSYGANPFFKDNDNAIPLNYATNKGVASFLERYSNKFRDYSPALFFDFVNEYKNIAMEIGNEFVIDINKLKEINPIKKGAFGDVWKGTYNGNIVAIKKFMKEMRGSSLEMFYREVALLVKCKHQNIVETIGYHLLDKADPIKSLYPTCIVLEYVPRGSLSERLKKLKAKKLRLKKDTIISYAIDIAEGMKYLHNMGVIHRDLKSGNILITKENHLKIIDFGLARYKAGATDITTEMSINIGTFNWMAPEILRGESDYTSKVDVYSYGLVLWEMVFRDIPYKKLLMDVGREEFRSKVGFDKPTLKLPKKKYLPDEMIDLLARCWDYNPNNRPEFSEICETLKEIKNKK
ncbi:serine/threonine-protein kinase sty8-like [Anaeramoeba ignava]|uniref:Serine/threonine-protein kinase sty8-like n=1 Tax=Anaeramoeba ignava TaxID=1746090 RepID=A0A9Q0LQG7_ANAIG|nr:serine/threonine-protein kinase sty8-like [Anaeramoeba ignava]